MNKNQNCVLYAKNEIFLTKKNLFIKKIVSLRNKNDKNLLKEPLSIKDNYYLISFAYYKTFSFRRTF